LDGLFDDDNDEEEEYKEGVEEEGRDVETEDTLSGLFGDVDDIENEEKDTKGKASGGEASESLNRSKEDLQGLCHSSLPLNLLLDDVQSNLAQLGVCSPLEPYVFRGAEADADADAEVAAAAGGKSEGFHPIIHPSQDRRELSCSQACDPQTNTSPTADLQSDPGQTSSCHTEDQDTSR